MAKLAMVVLWPSFLVAILAEGFFFSLFNPADMVLDGSPVRLQPQTVYSLGFFCFWLFCSLAGMLSVYLLRTPNEHRVPF